MLAALAAPAAAAQGFPFPRPLPCAGPNVVPDAVQSLSLYVAAAERAISEERVGVWRPIRDVAEAACRAGDRATLDAVLEHCFDECSSKDDLYLARLDYAATLARFGDAAAAETQYRAAIELRPGRPSEAIEAYNQYALLLQREDRPAEALALLNRFDVEELRTYSFAALLKIWVMNELGMDVAAEQAALVPALAGVTGGAVGSMLFPPMPPTPGEIRVEPLVVEVREPIAVAPREHGSAGRERGRLEFNRMGTRNPMSRPPNFTIDAGERFVMVAVLGGDACRIEHAGNSYDLVFCPWLVPGNDDGRDLYRTRPRARDATVAELRAPGAVTIAPIPPFIGPPSGSVSDAELWRRFYDNLERLGSAYVEEVLVRQISLDADETAAVLAAAADYVREIASIDEAARAQIAARFGAPAPIGLPMPAPIGRADAQPTRPTVLIPGRTPDGRLVQAVLVEEGFIARVETEKATALAAHRERVLRAVGRARLGRLESAARGTGSPTPVVGPPSLPPRALR